MPRQSSSQNLEDLLKELEKVSRAAEEISIRDLRDAVGRRSFAPVLLLASILGITPLGGIPGVPTALAVIVFLVASQVLLGRDSVWMPGFLLSRRIESHKLRQAAHSLKPSARALE